MILGEELAERIEVAMASISSRRTAFELLIRLA
jgi:hypothetical protein